MKKALRQQHNYTLVVSQMLSARIEAQYAYDHIVVTTEKTYIRV